MNISKDEFNTLLKNKKNFIITNAINGDELTPIGVFQNLTSKNKALLESIGKDGNKSRYSIIAITPYKKVYGEKDIINIVDEKGSETLNIDPLEYLKIETNKDIKSDFPFLGGAIGYFGYDMKKNYENIADAKRDTLNVPDFYMMFYKNYIIFDHLMDTVYFAKTILADEDNPLYEEIEKEFSSLEKEITTNRDIKSIDQGEKIEFNSNMEKSQFEKMVTTAKEYIKNGDIFQVVLSQRFSGKFTSDEFSIYRKLRRANPSSYMFYIEYDEFKVLGSSPESLISVKDGIIKTNPIAGTRKRGNNDLEDEKIIEGLLNDEKEVAEHLMLVDLGRNDVGRVSEIGSVKVESMLNPQKYSRVIHLTAMVSGKIKKDIHPLEGFKSVFPAGTLSGAPKIRAMEIINELEEDKRGVYGGAVGYISFNGDIDFAIAIRTALLKDSIAYVQAGAGVVYDSIEENEYFETYNKALGVMEVMG
ncbi:anthranilate synthase component I [Clostridium cylindrosporum]|uniref:Anthranilate synthase component 1 n=1 Tax=Clostridium cylindrosporum DSM 605 TaxID=1121307 RepID=A0A0J8D9B7_CLOCY|nr:anthranilate synthase component I [Clostridium cylindrosporum]KMT20924.1 anthranilate synthase component 1 [Clostridium cylindrosporum DSM 605]